MDNNGNAGFWQPFDIEGGNAAGNGFLSEAKVGTKFVSLNSPTDICKGSFDFTRIFGATVGPLDGSWQIAAVSGIPNKYPRYKNW